MPSEFSGVVAAGMKRICADLHQHLATRNFRKSGARKWVRERGELLEYIYLFRRGSTYGATTDFSVDIRVEAWVSSAIAPDKRNRFFHNDASVRKADGYCYHHRFNAKTWSTYERCLEEMVLYVEDELEPWFSDPAPPGNVWVRYVRKVQRAIKVRLNPNK